MALEKLEFPHHFAVGPHGRNANDRKWVRVWDVAAASREARRLMAGRYGRFGLYGMSQGGWVAPLAAPASGAQFVAVSYGGVFSPIEEESEEVILGLREKGFDDAAIAQAGIAMDAVGAVLESNFTSGFDRLLSVKKRYGQEAWFSHIVERREGKLGEQGHLAGDILFEDEAALRTHGAEKYNSIQVRWAYNPLPALRNLSIPILWVIAGEDRESVPRLTNKRLSLLKKEGRKIDAFVFPDTDHGIFEFKQNADGSRDYTRAAEGFHKLVADWIKDERSPPYGGSQPLER